MVKKKLNKTDFKPPPTYKIIGICTHLKDYSLAWTINKNLKLNLSKTNDFSFYIGKDHPNINYSSYYYEDIINHTTYLIIANRCFNKVLIPEFKHINYLILINSPIDNTNIFIESIKNITNVLGVYNIEYEQVKKIDSIMDDMEYHLLDIYKYQLQIKKSKNGIHNKTKNQMGKN